MSLFGDGPRLRVLLVCNGPDVVTGVRNEQATRQTRRHRAGVLSTYCCAAAMARPRHRSASETSADSPTPDTADIA